MSENESCSPYSRVTPEEMILRDRLAVDRTDLANERTLLAYIRTFLALLVTGVTALHLMQESWARLAGAIFVLCAAIIGVVGVVRFMTIRRRYTKLR